MQLCFLFCPKSTGTEKQTINKEVSSFFLNMSFKHKKVAAIKVKNNKGEIYPACAPKALASNLKENFGIELPNP